MTHVAYIALVLALLAFGKWYADQADEGGYNRCVASYESQLRIDLNDKIAENTALQSANDQLVVDLLNKKPEVETVYKTIEKKVEVYVKDNVACNLSLGAVELRNRAAKGEQLPNDPHSALPEAEAKTTSTITQRAAERHVYQWGKQYNELSDRYVTLLKICDKKQ